MAEKKTSRTGNRYWGRKENWQENKKEGRDRQGQTSKRFKEKAKSRMDSIRHSNATSRTAVFNPDLRVNVNSDNFQNQKFLNEMFKNQSAEEVMTFLMSNMEVFTQILSTDISEELLLAILNLIAKSCAITFATNKCYVLKSTLQKKFVNAICSFLSGLIVDDTRDDQFWHNFGDVLNNILTILENAMQLIPMTTWEYIRTIVKTITLVLPVLQQSKKFKLPENFDSKVTSLKDDIQKIKMRFEKQSKTTPDQHSALYQADDDSDQNEPDYDYRFIDVFPKIEELTNPDRPFLRKNIIKGKYKSVQHYIDVHFRLMREDFINPIREDICDHLSNIKRKLFNIRVHKKVSFINKNVEKDLICFRIKIELSQYLQNYIRTGQNKRFMHGTLLFFSTDSFQSMFCGRVVSSDELKNGVLLVNLPCKSDIDYTKDYSMIECIVFFEPYYQVLNALRKISYQQFPMEKYLLQLETNILSPKYMENVKNLKIPAGLNSSQKNAISAALNKEVVIIQGPPGTGKTFLGRTMVEVLLQHKECWQKTGPMLVLCYTNHALDQFLDELFKFTGKIVRLGGKSSNLFEISRKYDAERQFNKASSVFKQLKWVKKNIDEIHKELGNISEQEKDRIYAKTICEWDFTEYRFQNSELFCWLLCDDGTISSKQNKKVKASFAENSIVEEDKIYDLLFNFILSNIKESEYSSYLSIPTLERIAMELSSYLKSGTNKIQHRYFKEQYDFLLSKIKYLKVCLKTDFGDLEVEFEDYPDPFAIPSKHRWQLYKHWVKLYKSGLTISLDDLYDKYQSVYNIYNGLKENDNIGLFKKMDIIGMTTTCAARLRSTLEQLSSPIVIVEEAAEVLESHIITALTKDCQHLILLGDHQQLRPKTSDYTIEKQYNLGISLFERMVLNNVECHNLNVQHRMRPEISRLISPLFYKELFNHPSVETYPLVSGIGSPLYFIDHTQPEEPYGESSRMNMHEAKFLIELTIYLLNNNYKPEDITILAAYLGQSYVLKQEQKKSEHKGLQEVRIAVVDNFQGEENKIILLSLVRNNSDQNVGFLSNDNRVCVALSRAKEGLYIMGNMTHLCEASDIWKSIRSTLEAQQAIGKYLPLHCKNHKGHITLVSKPNDFFKVPEGGCNRSCDALLECGHSCIKICHSYDVDHKLYNCEKSCLRLLCDNPDHKCKKKCLENCGSCHYPVRRKLNCGHEETLSCSKNIDDFICLKIVKKQLTCGHQQNSPCHTTLDSHTCLELVEFTPQCGHTRTIQCFKKSELTKGLSEAEIDAYTLDSYKCLELVEFTPQCGHTQNISCFKKSELTKGLNKTETDAHTLDSYKCLEIVEFTPHCGHTQNLSCFEKSALTKALEKTKSDDHTLVLHKCLELVEFTPQCGHTQTISCFKKSELTKGLSETEIDAHTLDSYKCLEIVEFTPQCGHTQTISCFEKSALIKSLDETKSDAYTPVLHKCSELVEFTPQCGHTQTISCFKKTELTKGLNETETDAHKQLDLYKCLELVEFTPQCGHTQTISCSKKSKLTKGLNKTETDAQTLDSYKCLEIVEFTPHCGHTQNLSCFEKSALTKALEKTKSDDHTLVLHKCLELVEFTPQCGHTQSISCFNKSELTKDSHNTKSDIYTLNTYKCLRVVEFTPQCGHTQNIPCFKKSELTKGSNKTIGDTHDTDTPASDVSLFCKVKTEKRIPKCGHYQTVACSEDLTAFKCQGVTEITLKCGHKQEKLCSLEEQEISCSKNCGQMLECGHKCLRKCHRNDVSHFKYKCMKPCNKNLKGCRNPQKHRKCPLLCFKKCQPCTETVINSYESCSHIEITKCYKSNTTCYRQCGKKLSCGHFCTNKCCNPCRSSCELKTFKKIPDCGHKIEVQCNENPLQINCKKPCTKILDCGHNCTNKCNEPCTKNCNERCQKKLECGHDCIKSCQESCACKMEVFPHCGHPIPIKCGDAMSADQCEILCMKTLNCGHRQLTKCNKAIENLRCIEGCENMLECGHRCQEKCGEPCTSLDKCKRQCNKMLSCNHSCKNMCHETCTDKCLEQCTKELKCGHKCTNPCSSECITVCKSKCNKILCCGHFCTNKCCNPCRSSCVQKTFKEVPDCGHIIEVRCNENPLQKNCKKQCTKILDCGHNCTKKCNEPCTTKCTDRCQKLLECGHECIKSCHERCACKMEVSPHCGHSIPIKCGEVVFAGQCEVRKFLNCGHHQSTKCNEAIENIRCLAKCDKKLECGHQCQEKCGQPCTSLDKCRGNKTVLCSHSCKMTCSRCQGHCLRERLGLSKFSSFKRNYY